MALMCSHRNIPGMFALIKQSYRLADDAEKAGGEETSASMQKADGELEIRFNLKEGDFESVTHKCSMKVTIKTGTMDVPVDQEIEQATTCTPAREDTGDKKDPGKEAGGEKEPAPQKEDAEKNDTAPEREDGRE